jgi:hypothetical protein
MTALTGFLLCMVLSAPAFGQTGSIGGTITDKEGEKLPYVTVAAKNTATGMQRLSTTNEDGVYSIEGLSAGTYNLSADAQGFVIPDMPNVEVREAEPKRLDLQMTMLTSERMFRVTRPFFNWAENTWVGKMVRSHQYPFAVIEVVHLFGLTLLLGGIFMMSLRLFGLIMRDMPVPQVAKQLGWISFLGIIIMVTTGASLFASEALKCYNSGMYWYKMAFFFPATLFHFTMYRKVTRSETSAPFLRGLTGFLALFLWFGVAVFGRAIGYF